MTIEQQYNVVKEAVKNDKLKQLMLGTETFGWEELQHMPANVPSDISSILRCGLYKLHLESNSNVPALLISTINELLQGSPVEIWVAYSVVWHQYRNELMNASPFKIISQELLSATQTSVNKSKDVLTECKNFVGANCKDGLFGDIIVSNNSLQKRFNVSIL